MRRSRGLAVAFAFAVLVAGCGGGGGTRTVQRGFAAFARNADEARVILGSQATPQELRAMHEAARGLPGALDLAVQSDQLLQAVASSDNGVVSIVAHNARGTLRFADGSALPLADISAAIPRDVERIVAVIGCSTTLNQGGQVIGVPSRITLDAGVEIHQRFSNWVSAQDGVPLVAAAQAELTSIAMAVASQESQRLADIGSRTRLIALSGFGALGAGTLGVTVYELET